MTEGRPGDGGPDGPGPVDPAGNGDGGGVENAGEPPAPEGDPTASPAHDAAPGDAAARDAAALDSATDVRPGEELDVARLERHLRRHLPQAGVEVPPGPLEVEQFPSGWSNLTYLLRFGPRRPDTAPDDAAPHDREAGEPATGTTAEPAADRPLELVLRRPPFGNVVAGAHDMAREHRVLSALAPAWGLAPRPYLLCEDRSVLGAPFYVMERVRGLILRRDAPPGFDLTPDLARRLSESLVDGLAGLHALDPAQVGLGDLGRPEGYVRRQVEGWAARYQAAKTDDHPDLERVARWLLSHQPPEPDPPPAVLVHNDYKYDNLVLDPADPGTIRAVLDWEMCTVGDPLLDLGTTLGYWVEADDPEPLRAFALGPTAAPGSLTRRQLAERYAGHTGADLTHLPFHHAFGLFKIAVIVQQIYARWVAGKTRDPRFADLDRVVGLFGRVAAGVAGC